MPAEGGAPPLILDPIASVYATTTPTPVQRAAILEGLARINGDLEPAVEADGTATVAYSADENRDGVIRTLAFGQDGWLTRATITTTDGNSAARALPETTSSVEFLPPQSATTDSGEHGSG